VAGFSAGVVNAQGTFEAGEKFVSLFGSYVDKPGDHAGIGVGVGYFITERFGVGMATHLEETGGSFIDNVSAEGYLRFPIGDSPVAPYAVASVGHSFETEELFISVGGGAEYQINDRLRAFGDLSWQVNEDSKDGTALRLGVRLGF
jgi:hypothetical protein